MRVAVSRWLPVVMTVSLLALAGVEPALAQVSPVEPQVKPATIVILADESGSISLDDLSREKDATGLIAQSEFASESSVAVVGFGSEVPGVPAFDEVCPLQVVGSAAQRQQLSTCVAKLNKRTKGDGTDHAAALDQALSYFSGPADGPRIVFLLTDGVLDVGDTTRYGVDKTAQQKTDAANEQIDTLLKQAAGQRVQVWPLGFGNADKAALDRFAAGGFQGECGPGTRAPSAAVVASAGDVVQTIFDAYSAGRCAGIGPIQPGIVNPGQTLSVPVTIPAIATDGSITVVKHDPRIGVQYIDPSGHPVPKFGTLNGSSFQASGESGPVEALRISDPQSGVWTVNITAPSDSPPQDVSTTVTWQGAVQAVLAATPGAVQAGQPVTVRLSLRTRRGPVTDASQLSGLTFAASLTPAGDSAVPIALNDDGGGSDRHAHDGTYTGTVAVPTQARGTATVMGSVQGIGISGDAPQTTLQVTDGPSPLLVNADLPDVSQRVAPGGTVSGTVHVTNNTGKPQRVLLLIDQGSGPGWSIPGSSSTADVAVSGNTDVTVELAAASDMAEGTSDAVLKVVDAANPRTEYGSFPFVIRVQPDPPYLLYGAIAVALLLFVAAAVLFLARRRSQDLGGSIVKIKSGGSSQSLPLVPPGVRELRFTIRRPSSGSPEVQLAHEGRDDPAYKLTRRGNTLRLRQPTGKSLDLAYDVPGSLSDDMKIVVSTSSSSLGPSSSAKNEPVKPGPRASHATHPDL